VQRTRWQILETLKKRGPSTLDELARSIGLVAPTVRVHLSVLQRDNLVTADEVRGKVGRPHFLYSLTEDALELFPRHYDRLARSILAELRESYGSEKVAEILMRMTERWVEELAPRLEGKSLSDRVAVVAEARREEGAMAEWSEAGGGYVFAQYNCPSLRVAQSHPELCRAEEHFLRLALRADIKRRACVLSDARCCAFLVTEPEPKGATDLGPDPVQAAG
jgi:predicted ArsR family transcriptional regulator